MCEHRRRKAASPRAQQSKDESDEKRCQETTFALVEMGRRKKRSGSNDPGQNRSCRGSLKNSLHKSSVEKFFAERNRYNEREKHKLLDRVLRHDLARHVAEKSAAVRRQMRKAPNAEKLVDGQQCCKRDRDTESKSQISE
jgi:hypothetical protein